MTKYSAKTWNKGDNTQQNFDKSYKFCKAIVGTCLADTNKTFIMHVKFLINENCVCLQSLPRSSTWCLQFLEGQKYLEGLFSEMEKSFPPVLFKVGRRTDRCMII